MRRTAFTILSFCGVFLGGIAALALFVMAAYCFMVSFIYWSNMTFSEKSFMMGAGIPALLVGLYIGSYLWLMVDEEKARHR